MTSRGEVAPGGGDGSAVRVRGSAGQRAGAGFVGDQGIVHLEELRGPGVTGQMQHAGERTAPTVLSQPADLRAADQNTVHAFPQHVPAVTHGSITRRYCATKFGAEIGNK